jgi:hypothetical protein
MRIMKTKTKQLTLIRSLACRKSIFLLETKTGSYRPKPLNPKLMKKTLLFSFFMVVAPLWSQDFWTEVAPV